MPIAADVIDNIVSVSDFSHGKASAIFSNVRDDAPVVVVKNNKPTAVLVSPSEYRRLSEAQEDLAELELALARMKSNGEKPGVSESEVMARLGISDADLDAISDDQIEFS